MSCFQLNNKDMFLATPYYIVLMDREPPKKIMCFYSFLKLLNCLLYQWDFIGLCKVGQNTLKLDLKNI